MIVLGCTSVYGDTAIALLTADHLYSRRRKSCNFFRRCCYSSWLLINFNGMDITGLLPIIGTTSR